MTDRTRLRRHPERGGHEAAAVYAIVDEAPMCQVGVLLERSAGEGNAAPFPLVVPMVHGRFGDTLYLHGALANATLAAACEHDVCVTFTLLDGFVLARSAFHHSVNFRSAVVFGRAERVTDPEEQLLASRAITDHVLPGRSDAVRAPNEGELRRTAIVRMSLTEASVKVRTGPPVDDEADLERPVWAGVVPVTMCAGTPIPHGDGDFPAPATRFGAGSDA